MVIVTVTDTVTDRRAVSQSAGEEGRGPGKEGLRWATAAPVRSWTSVAPVWILECEWS